MKSGGLFILLVGLLLPLTAVAQDSRTMRLSGSFAADSVSLTFDYPDEWAAAPGDLNQRVFLATEESLLAEPNLPLAAGQMRATIYAAAIDDLPNIHAKSGYLDVLSLVTQGETTGADCQAMTTPQTFEVNDFTGLSVEQTCGAIDHLFLLVDHADGTFAAVYAATPTGELDDFRATLIEISGTAHYVPPLDAPQLIDTTGIELSERYLSAGGGFRFQFPTGWHIMEETIRDKQVIVVTPDRNFNIDHPEPGAPFALILLDTVSDVTDEPLSPRLAQRPLDAMNALNTRAMISFSAPTGLSVGGRIGSRTDADSRRMDNSAFILMINDDDYAYMNVVAASGDLAEYEVTFLSVLASFELIDFEGDGPVA